jgi:hypothetical protein
MNNHIKNIYNTISSYIKNWSNILLKSFSQKIGQVIFYCANSYLKNSRFLNNETQSPLHYKV